MSEAMFARLRMAYMRGATWREENGSLDLVEKASYDYADKETSPLTENYREPGEFGEGATGRRAEPTVDYRTCGVAELAAANPNVMSYVKEREDEIDRRRRDLMSAWNAFGAEIAKHPDDLDTLPLATWGSLAEQITELTKQRDDAEKMRVSLIETAEQELLKLTDDYAAEVEKRCKYEAVLRKIAAYDDAGANAYLRATGSYRCFDEPGAVELARAVLEGGSC